MSEENTENQPIETETTAVINGIEVKAKRENVQKLKSISESISKIQAENEMMSKVTNSALEENFDLKSEKIADKLGISKSDINQSNFKEYKRKAEIYDFEPKPAPTYEGAPLNPPIDYNPNSRRTTYKLDEESKIPVDLMEYDNVNDCITDLNQRSKEGDKESQRYLAQLTKQFFKGNATWEFTGKSTLNLIKDPPKILPTDSEQVVKLKRKKAAEIMKDRLSWERVE